MMPMGIPDWNAQGVLPPISVSDATSRLRSPYVVSLSEVMLRFGSTPQRQAILDGFLQYRGVLHAVGLAQASQWLNGSFLENIETLESRPPNDMDVVTFFRRPSGETEQSLVRRAPILADRMAVKQRFHADAYLVGIDAEPEVLAERFTHWYSMWSHRRDGVWKGYLQVDLSPSDDVAAWSALASRRTAGVQP